MYNLEFTQRESLCDRGGVILYKAYTLQLLANIQHVN